MLVLDDGWFGKRDSDNSGLGDWFVNEEKLGCSLKTLVEKSKRYGTYVWNLVRAGDDIGRQRFVPEASGLGNDSTGQRTGSRTGAACT